MDGTVNRMDRRKKVDMLHDRNCNQEGRKLDQVGSVGVIVVVMDGRTMGKQSIDLDFKSGSCQQRVVLGIEE